MISNIIVLLITEAHGKNILETVYEFLDVRIYVTDRVKRTKVRGKSLIN